MPTGRAFRYSTGLWSNSDILTNPTDGTVMVQTPAVPQASVDLLLAVVAAGTVAFTYDVQHRNAANDANLASQRRIISAAGNDEFLFPSILTLNQNERVRVVLVGPITGDLQVSIFSCAVL
jgi:hypothetical protein